MLFLNKTFNIFPIYNWEKLVLLASRRGYKETYTYNDTAFKIKSLYLRRFFLAGVMA